MYGQLPKNNLRKLQMSRLKVFPDEDHPFKDNILKDYETEFKQKLEATIIEKAKQAERR